MLEKLVIYFVQVEDIQSSSRSLFRNNLNTSYSYIRPHWNNIYFFICLLDKTKTVEIKNQCFYHWFIHLSPVREDDNPEVDRDKQSEDHVGEPHTQTTLWWTHIMMDTYWGTYEKSHTQTTLQLTLNFGSETKEPWDTLRMVNTPLAMLMAMRSPARSR